MIHTASMAGRFIGGFSGPIYTAAKHGVVAMSHSINMEECVNGIRSTVFLPGEVATPILDKRPNPVGPEERARMVQSEDCGDLIRYIACLPRHVVMNEVMLAPDLEPRLRRQPATQALKDAATMADQPKKVLVPNTMGKEGVALLPARDDIEARDLSRRRSPGRSAAAAGGRCRHRAVAARRTGRPSWMPHRRCRSWRASASATTRWRCRR